MTGANSAVGLRSTPARYIFLDEVDAYPAWADEEGDPVTLAEARSLTFAHRRKVLLVSTPTIRGLSRIELEFEASDQRRFFVPCPHCGHAQWLKFEWLRWNKGQPETAAYHCEGCEAPIGVASRSKIGRGRTTVPIFLLVPQVKLPKRLDLARDADRALDSVPGLIVANWVEGKFNP